MQGKSLVYLTVILILALVGFLVITAPASAQTDKKIKRVNIAGGSIGGTTNLIANCYASILKKYLGIDSTVLTYPIARIAVSVGTKEVEIGTSNSEQSNEPYEGIGFRKGKEPLRGLREFTPHAFAILQIYVPVNSPIKTFRDLVGKRISPGTKGMGPASMLEKVCPSLGLSLEKDFSVVYMGHQEAGSALVSGKIAAYMASAAPPQPTLMEVDLLHPLRLIGFTEPDIKVLAKEIGGVVGATVPPKYYHMREAVSTIASIGHSLAMYDLSEDIVYGLVKNLYRDLEFVGYHYPTFKKFIGGLEDYKELGAKYWVEASPSATKIPFHRGAVRYYKEIGWKVPAERIPPEMQK